MIPFGGKPQNEGTLKSSTLKGSSSLHPLILGIPHYGNPRIMNNPQYNRSISVNDINLQSCYCRKPPFKNSSHPPPEKGMLSPTSEPSQGGPRIFRGTLGEETCECFSDGVRGSDPHVTNERVDQHVEFQDGTNDGTLGSSKISGEIALGSTVKMLVLLWRKL